MKQKVNLMMLLLFGVLSSCGKNIDWTQDEEHVYVNQTTSVVRIIGYSTDPAIDGSEWQIAPQSCLTIITNLTMGGGEASPHFCDSVILLFDDGKEIRNMRGEGVLSEGEVEKVSDHHKRYTHYITTAMKESAR